MLAKRLRILIIALGIVSGGELFAKADLGLGIIIGEPTGLSLKYGQFSFAAGWDLDKGIHAHGDYWLFDKAIRGPLSWYLGPGLKLVSFDNDNNNKNAVDDDILVAIRFPVGLRVMVADNKVDIFAEIVPSLMVIPETDIHLDAAIGARYFF